MSHVVEEAGRSPYSADEWATLNAGVTASPSRTLSERMNYPSMAGIVVATLLIAVPLVGFVALVVDVVMILRYVFGYRAPGSPQWSIHHPSPVSLVVVWMVAVCTVVVYPLAIYMTVRFLIEYRARWVAEVRQCPRCAETVKAAALVCRYCSQELDPVAPAPAPGLVTSSIAGVQGPTGGTATRSSRRVFYVIGGIAAAGILGYRADLCRQPGLGNRFASGGSSLRHRRPGPARPIRRVYPRGNRRPVQCGAGLSPGELRR